MEKGPKFLITYERYGIMAKTLTEMIKKSNVDFDFIHVIPRGGYPLAVHLSHFLDLEIKNELLPSCEKHVLVVDDLIDEGHTLSHFSMHPELFKIAVLFTKPWSPFKPDYYIGETENWIVFPWEDPEETPNRKGYKNTF